MGIGEIITAIGMAIGGSAVLLAILGWLARSLIVHLLSKDIETFKANVQMESKRELAQLKSSLDKDIEAFKTNLQLESQRELTHLKSTLELSAFEHQTRFSRLHEKRAEIIGTLYGKTVDLYKSVSDFVSFFPSSDDQTKEKKLQLLWNIVDNFVEYFEKHAIYFDRVKCTPLSRYCWRSLYYAQLTFGTGPRNRLVSTLVPTKLTLPAVSCPDHFSARIS